MCVSSGFWPSLKYYNIYYNFLLQEDKDLSVSSDFREGSEQQHEPLVTWVDGDWLTGKQKTFNLWKAPEGPYRHKQIWRHGGKTENRMRPGRYACHLNGGMHQMRHTNTLCYLDLRTAGGFQYQAWNRAAAFCFLPITDPSWDNLLPGWLKWQKTPQKINNKVKGS